MELLFALCCLYKTLGIVIFLELFMWDIMYVFGVRT